MAVTRHAQCYCGRDIPAYSPVAGGTAAAHTRLSTSRVAVDSWLRPPCPSLARLDARIVCVVRAQQGGVDRRTCLVTPSTAEDRRALHQPTGTAGRKHARVRPATTSTDRRQPIATHAVVRPRLCAERVPQHASERRRHDVGPRGCRQETTASRAASARDAAASAAEAAAAVAAAVAAAGAARAARERCMGGLLLLRILDREDQGRGVPKIRPRPACDGAAPREGVIYVFRCHPASVGSAQRTGRVISLSPLKYATPSRLYAPPSTLGGWSILLRYVFSRE